MTYFFWFCFIFLQSKNSKRKCALLCICITLYQPQSIHFRSPPGQNNEGLVIEMDYETIATWRVRPAALHDFNAGGSCSGLYHFQLEVTSIPLFKSSQSARLTPFEFCMQGIFFAGHVSDYRGPRFYAGVCKVSTSWSMILHL